MVHVSTQQTENIFVIGMLCLTFTTLQNILKGVANMSLGQHIGKGNTADIYMWETGVIIKLFDAKLPDFLIEQELLANQEAEQLSLPVPKTYGAKSIEGRQGILYEKIDGQSLTNLLFQDPPSVDQKAREFASLHQLIHQAKSDRLPSLKEILKRNIQHAVSLTEDEKANITEYVYQLPDGEQVCHMDFHPDNILYSASGPKIIDWMTAVRGNSFADVARTMVILTYASLPPSLPEDVRQAIVKIRNQFASHYVQAYFQQVEGSMEHVEQWYLPIMAARLVEGVPAEEKKVLLKEIRHRLANL